MTATWTATWHTLGAVSLGAVGLYLAQRVYAHASRTEARAIADAEALAARRRPISLRVRP